MEDVGFPSWRNPAQQALRKPNPSKRLSRFAERDQIQLGSLCHARIAEEMEFLAVLFHIIVAINLNSVVSAQARIRPDLEDGNQGDPFLLGPHPKAGTIPMVTTWDPMLAGLWHIICPPALARLGRLRRAAG